MRAGVSAGAIVGLTTGALLAIFIGVVNFLGIETVRNVFIAVKPELMSLLTFGHAGVVGSVLRIGAEVVLGAVGGAIGATQDRVRVPTVIAATVVISLGLLRRIVHPALAQLGLRDDWLFSVVTLGLTWFGAAARVRGDVRHDVRVAGEQCRDRGADAPDAGDGTRRAAWWFWP